MIRVAGMDVPRLVAIDDVRLTAPEAAEEALRSFYAGVLGLEYWASGGQDRGRPAGADRFAELVFRGYPRSGPRLIVALGVGQGGGRSINRRLRVQVSSLDVCGEEMAKRRIEFSWSRGWSFHDRRLIGLDPAGNWVELVAHHPW